MENDGEIGMKSKNNILVGIIIVDVLIIMLMNEARIKAQTWFGNAFGAFCFFLPIELLLFRLGNDKKYSYRTRIIFRIILVCIAICYVLGGIATLVN